MEPVQIDFILAPAVPRRQTQINGHGHPSGKTHQSEDQEHGIVFLPPVQAGVYLFISVPGHSQRALHPQHQIQSHGSLSPAVFRVLGPAAAGQIVLVAEGIGADDVFHRGSIDKHAKVGDNAQQVPGAIFVEIYGVPGRSISRALPVLLHSLAQLFLPVVGTHHRAAFGGIADAAHHAVPGHAQIIAHVHGHVGDVVFPPVQALGLHRTLLHPIPVQHIALRVQQLPAQIGLVCTVLFL